MNVRAPMLAFALAIGAGCGRSEDSAAPKPPAPPAPVTKTPAPPAPPSPPPAVRPRPAPVVVKALPMFEITDPGLRGGPAFIDGDRVYCVDGESLVAIGLPDGTRAWRYGFPNLAGGTGLVRAGRRAVLRRSNGVHLVSLDDGKAVHEMRNPGIDGTLRAVDDFLVSGFRGAAVFESDTLKPLWKREYPGRDSYEVLLAEADGVLIQPELPDGSSRLEWVDLRTGVPRWTLAGPRVYGIRRRGGLLAAARTTKVHAEIDLATGRVLYESPQRLIHPGAEGHRVLFAPGVEVHDRATGRTLWAEPSVRLLHCEDELLVYLRGEEVVRVDPATGGTLWSVRPGLKPKELRRFGDLFVVHDGSELVAIDVASGSAGPRQGKPGFSSTTTLADGSWLLLMKSVPFRLLAFRLKPS